MTNLTPTAQKFIIHWGEMGERWGINRTIAQIHALLYITSKPLNAEEICDALSLARSTVSVGLRELQNWKIVKVVHVLGDRTDHFETLGDVWEMFRVIVNNRKCQELDPTLEMLREAVGILETNQEDPHTLKKLTGMLDLFETVSSVYEQAKDIPTKTVVRIAKMSNIVSKILKVFPD
ncbi:MAG: hypothetical protein JXA13_15250 [Anaerolineales bacterium]|nr:hypothetical protein [Anaerolineales bacterium]